MEKQKVWGIWRQWKDGSDNGWWFLDKAFPSKDEAEDVALVIRYSPSNIENQVREIPL